MIEIPEMLLKECHHKGIVVMAGAGVSASPPSSLPGWNQLNQIIFDAIADRVDQFVELPDYTANMRSLIRERRSAHQFPPDYQAQILAESCGDEYFEALKAVDITSFNSAHSGITQLAKHGIVKAIVTTNFDRLIEKALESEGVQYEVAYEPKTYKRCAQTLKNISVNTPVQILKLHGCVQDHLSMIDTLKQRLLGRNKHLLQCVEKLLEKYLWLYIGFSAADLESDKNYLGITSAVDKSPGLVYVRWPGTNALSPGAEFLVNAYGKKAKVMLAESEDVLREIANNLDLPWTQLPFEKSETMDYVTQSLAKWASGLSPVNAIMCLAGVLEANGESTTAFEVLHRLWKNRTNELMYEDENFDRYRLMHGRLGMGTGILSLVEDLGIDRGMESIQNLFRVAKKDLRAYAWSGLAWAWAGDIKRAFQTLLGAEPLFLEDTAMFESKVDVWLALSEIAFLSGEVEEHLSSWESANAWAENAGDLPRQAEVASFYLLLLAEFMDEVFESFYDEHASGIIERSTRLHDPNIEGFYNLARGRMATIHRDGEQAAALLNTAIQQLSRAGRYPWCTYAKIEYAKALMDQQQYNETADLLDHINETIDRHQVLLPWYQEARGQYHLLIGRKDIARSAFEGAVEYAEKMGLPRRANIYRQYLDLIA